MNDENENFIAVEKNDYNMNETNTLMLTNSNIDHVNNNINIIMNDYLLLSSSSSAAVE